jgi:hypothetical protein
MRLPTALRNLDDRVIGRGSRKGAHEGSTDGDTTVDTTSRTGPDGEEGRDGHHVRGDRGGESAPPRRPAGDVVREVLGVVWRVARLVFLALALVVFLGIVLTFAPTNDDNTIVRTILDWAETVAGPFRDVFTADDPDRKLLYNYALATAVYLLAASLVTKLPGRRGTT